MRDDRPSDPRPLFPGIGLLHDLAACLRFFSRLPGPALPEEPEPAGPPDFRRAARMLPVAGLLLSLPAALVLIAAWASGLGPFVAAALALTVQLLVTGAMHEDGLADVADGFGGGATRARILEIMRDSRIGAYGGAALVLAILLRLGALATLLDRTGALAGAALLLAAILSRTAALAPMALLGPARVDGASVSVGRPAPAALGIAVVATLVLSLAGIALGLPAAGVILALVFAPVAALALTGLARGRIGGQTGDVIGACQQVAEIAALIGLLAGTPFGRP